MKNTNPYKVGIYIRLSREDEKEKESSSIESQRDFLLSYIEEKGYHYIDEYVDDGYTGTNFERPSFKRLLRDIETDKINMVIVKDLSRLGRNNSKVSYYLDEYFPFYKVRFIAINNDYDSSIQNASTEYAWLTNGMNESYCLDISKKVRSALKVRKEKGYFTGWKAPYGYQRNPLDYHQLIVDEKACTIVKRIFKMAYEGKSSSTIADILSLEKVPTPSSYAHLNREAHSKTDDLWCARTISEMLTNETYIGNVTQGRRKKINYKIKKEIRVPKEDWIVIENTHEAIIDRNTFHTVQKLLQKKQKKDSKNSKLLSGFLICKECNHRMGISKSKDGKRAYIGCTYYRKYSKFKVCTPHTMNYQKLEDLILETLRKISKEVDITTIVSKLKNNNHHKINVESLSRQIESAKDHIKTSYKIMDRAYIDMGKGLLDLERYQSTIRQLEEDIIYYKKIVTDLEKKDKIQEENMEDYGQIVEKLLSFKNPTRSFIIHLIDKICIGEDKKIEIYFKCKPFGI